MDLLEILRYVGNLVYVIYLTPLAKNMLFNYPFMFILRILTNYLHIALNRVIKKKNIF